VRRESAALVLVLAGCQFTNTAAERRYLPRDADTVWRAARGVAQERARWTEVEACPVRGTLAYEARSAVFGFVDDFTVEVEPDPAHQGSRIRIDSRSREGKSDLGVNAGRIARFVDDVQLRLAATPAATTSATR
jgi:hypothetical protein